MTPRRTTEAEEERSWRGRTLTGRVAAPARGPDRRWETRYWSDGRRRSIYAKMRKEVADRLANALAYKGDAPAFVATIITVAEFLAHYEDVVRYTMKRRSFETYQSIAKVHLLPALGATKPKELGREHVQRMYSLKREAGLSAARMRRIHGVLSSALNHAVKWGLIEHNVCKEVSPPRVLNPEIRSFSRDEARRFLSATESNRYHALYVLGLASGMRLGEIGGLFWSDLDLGRRTL